MLYRSLAVLSLFALLCLAACAAQGLPAPVVTNEVLVPKRGVNSCLIDARFRISLEGVLGGVVYLGHDTVSAALTAKPGDASVQPLVNFRKPGAASTKTATEETLYHALLGREQTITASFLEPFAASMGRKDCLEVSTTERPSVSIAYTDIDIERLVATFSKLPAEQQAKLGVIMGLTPYVVSTAVYSEKPTSVGGNIFGVKVGRSWLYKAAEDKHDFYLVAVYAPVSLVVALANAQVAPEKIANLPLTLSTKSVTDDLLRQALAHVPLSTTHDRAPQPLLTMGEGGR